ncbi:MAG: lactonase family protein [Lachnospiraceae bacterium]|nr:lactonase family protein [Lachnospiraceae bacterium]
MSKYVAYVSSYTSTTRENFGIRIYDVDLKNGYLKERDEISISNSSYISISHNRKYLYSITDFGVEAYKIMPDGDLKALGQGTINGMRASYLSTDYDDKYLFTGGYHDGKITVLKLNPDGSIGEITDEVFHKGLGTIADLDSRPHVSCVKMTRDNKYLLAADLGTDNTTVYKFDSNTGKLTQSDIIHSDQKSGPRHIKTSQDGKYIYIVHARGTYIDVYEYHDTEHNGPDFEKIQSISTLNDYHASGSGASALNISDDFKYIVSSNAGDNSACMYSVDKKNGQLTKLFCLPVSGDYPKDVALFPDNRHLVSLNHESNTMTFFSVDAKKGLIVMNHKEIKVDQPNCIIFYEVKE